MFLGAPEEEQDKALIGFARTPPTDDQDCLIARLWDRFLGTDWRKPAPTLSPEMMAVLENFMKDMDEEQVNIDEELDVSEASSIELNRYIPERRGPFRLVPKGILPLKERKK